MHFHLRERVFLDTRTFDQAHELACEERREYTHTYFLRDDDELFTEGEESVSLRRSCVNSWLICSISLIYSQYLLTPFLSLPPRPTAAPSFPRVFSFRSPSPLLAPGARTHIQLRDLLIIFLAPVSVYALTLTRRFSLYLQIRHHPFQNRQFDEPDDRFHPHRDERIARTR